MKRLIAGVCLLSFAISPLAAVDTSVGRPPTASGGYVVRSEPGKVYIDFGRSSGIQPGQAFVVFKEGEELKHPITGKSLGAVEETLAEGFVEDVLEKYSTGKLSSVSGEIAPGHRVRLLETPAPTASAAPAQSNTGDAAKTRKPFYRSPILDLLAVDVAIGDVDGNGSDDIVVASKNEIRAYPNIQGKKRWQPICSLKIKTTGSKILSLEVSDLNKDGKAEIFATIYSSFYKRVETQILDCSDGTLKNISTIPSMVRSFQRPDGTWILGAQQLLADKTFPLSAIYELAFSDGKYVNSKKRVKHKRLEWLYGFNFASRENPAGEDAAPSPFLLFYARGEKIRAQYAKGAWTSNKSYGQTSERVTWHDNKLKFYPRFIVEQGPSGLSGVHTVKNIAGMFNLASAFGIYKSSELHFLRWNGMSLEPAWKTEMTGYAAGLAELGKGASASLVIPVSGVEDNTSIWFYRK